MSMKDNQNMQEPNNNNTSIQTANILDIEQVMPPIQQRLSNTIQEIHTLESEIDKLEDQLPRLEQAYNRWYEVMTNVYEQHELARGSEENFKKVASFLRGELKQFESDLETLQEDQEGLPEKITRLRHQKEEKLKEYVHIAPSADEEKTITLEYDPQISEYEKELEAIPEEIAETKAKILFAKKIIEIYDSAETAHKEYLDAKQKLEDKSQKSDELIAQKAKDEESEEKILTYLAEALTELGLIKDNQLIANVALKDEQILSDEKSEATPAICVMFKNYKEQQLARKEKELNYHEKLIQANSLALKKAIKELHNETIGILEREKSLDVQISENGNKTPKTPKIGSSRFPLSPGRFSPTATSGRLKEIIYSPTKLLSPSKRHISKQLGFTGNREHSHSSRSKSQNSLFSKIRRSELKISSASPEYANNMALMSEEDHQKKFAERHQLNQQQLKLNQERFKEFREEEYRYIEQVNQINAERNAIAHQRKLLVPHEQAELIASAVAEEIVQDPNTLYDVMLSEAEKKLAPPHKLQNAAISVNEGASIASKNVPASEPEPAAPLAESDKDAKGIISMLDNDSELEIPDNEQGTATAQVLTHHISQQWDVFKSAQEEVIEFIPHVMQYIDHAVTDFAVECSVTPSQTINNVLPDIGKINERVAIANKNLEKFENKKKDGKFKFLFQSKKQPSIAPYSFADLAPTQEALAQDKEDKDSKRPRRWKVVRAQLERTLDKIALHKALLGKQVNKGIEIHKAQLEKNKKYLYKLDDAIEKLPKAAKELAAKIAEKMPEVLQDEDDDAAYLSSPLRSAKKAQAKPVPLMQPVKLFSEDDEEEDNQGNEESVSAEVSSTMFQQPAPSIPTPHVFKAPAAPESPAPVFSQSISSAYPLLFHSSLQPQFPQQEQAMPASSVSASAPAPQPSLLRPVSYLDNEQQQIIKDHIISASPTASGNVNSLGNQIKNPPINKDVSNKNPTILMHQHAPILLANLKDWAEEAPNKRRYEPTSADGNVYIAQYKNAHQKVSQFEVSLQDGTLSAEGDNATVETAEEMAQVLVGKKPDYSKANKETDNDLVPPLLVQITAQGFNTGELTTIFVKLLRQGIIPCIKVEYTTKQDSRALPPTQQDVLNYLGKLGQTAPFLSLLEKLLARLPSADRHLYNARIQPPQRSVNTNYLAKQFPSVPAHEPGAGLSHASRCGNEALQEAQSKASLNPVRTPTPIPSMCK